MFVADWKSVFSQCELCDRSRSEATFTGCAVTYLTINIIHESYNKTPP